MEFRKEVTKALKQYGFTNSEFKFVLGVFVVDTTEASQCNKGVKVDLQEIVDCEVVSIDTNTIVISEAA